MTTAIDFQQDQDYAMLCRGQLANPYSIYGRLREEEPVHWSTGFNGWLLTRYTDVLDAFHDQRLESAPRLSSYINQLPPQTRDSVEPLYQHYATWLTNIDPPRHTRLRNLVNRAFTPRMINSLRPFIEQTVHQIIDSRVATGQMEVMGELACPLPSAVIARILGVPQHEWTRFQSWSQQISDFSGTGRPQVEKALLAQQSAEAMSEFVQRIARDPAVDPDQSLIAKLAAMAAEGDHLSESEMGGMCVFLLVAGHETTMALIANGLLAMLQNPDELGRLRENSELLGSAVEEMLRYDSPLQHQIRVAREDLEIGGRHIHQGERVVLLLGAANRDPAQFPQSDRFDIGREPNHHLAFGHGIHFCIGAPLARLEAKIVMQVLLERLPNLRLAPQEIHWRHHTSNRHPTKLTVVF
jgi:cytochrome P450